MTLFEYFNRDTSHNDHNDIVSVNASNPDISKTNNVQNLDSQT